MTRGDEGVGTHLTFGDQTCLCLYVSHKGNFWSIASVCLSVDDSLWKIPFAYFTVLGAMDSALKNTGYFASDTFRVHQKLVYIK